MVLDLDERQTRTNKVIEYYLKELNDSPAMPSENI